MNQVTCSTQTLNSSLADWLKSTYSENATLLKNTPWFLWVEPLAKAEQVYCPALFEGVGRPCSKLTTVLENDWQFSEFYLFQEGLTYHGLQLESGAYIRTIRAELDNTEQTQAPARTPYLRQDLKQRFELAQLSTSLTAQQLIFHALEDTETGLTEYVLSKAKQGEAS